MGARCVFKGPILWEHNACTEDPPYGSCAKDQLIQWEYVVSTKDQSYGDMMHVQRTNPMGQCM